MRWNASNVSFSRPIRWLLALFGGQVVPFEYAGVHAGRMTRGLRFLNPAEIDDQEPAGIFYCPGSPGHPARPRRSAGIPSPTRSSAWRSRRAGRRKLDETLLDEVNQLVEAPTALRGQFRGDRICACRLRCSSL